MAPKKASDQDSLHVDLAQVHLSLYCLQSYRAGSQSSQEKLTLKTFHCFGQQPCPEPAFVVFLDHPARTYPISCS